MSDLRKVEVFHEEGWKVVPLSEVKKGDKFRMFELTGGSVKSAAGAVEFIALRDAFLDSPHGWTVAIDE